MKRLSLLIFALVLNSGLQAQLPSPPLLLPGEHWTNLWSVGYDYQSNGSIRYLVQDPSNSFKWCAILMAQHDSNTVATVERYIYYAYSIDNGINWTEHVVNNIVSFGFPCVTLQNGVPVFAANQSNDVGTRVWRDSVFGSSRLTEIAGIPPLISAYQPIWPHIAGTTNGNLVMIGSPNDEDPYGHQTIYSSSWSAYSLRDLIGGPSGNYDVASGSGGNVAFIGTNYINAVPNSPGFAALNWYRSSNNGISFDTGAIITPGIIEGSDTVYAAVRGGYQCVYDGTTPHIVFAAYNYDWEATAIIPGQYRAVYKKSRIYHWTPATGFHVIASAGNIPNLCDTLNQVSMAPLTQPTITLTPSRKLICAFTAFLRGNVQIVRDGSIVNAGDIFYCNSNNNGTSWTVPQNITNTPNIEEKHPSFSPNTSNDNMRLFYLRDMLSGAWILVTGWGRAPVYGIFNSLYTIGADLVSEQIPTECKLFDNYPNPFNPSTKIKFDLPKSEFISLAVFDAGGRRISDLVDGILSAGSYEFQFDADRYGLSSGIYFYKLATKNFVETKRMVLLK